MEEKEFHPPLYKSFLWFHKSAKSKIQGALNIRYLCPNSVKEETSECRNGLNIRHQIFDPIINYTISSTEKSEQKLVETI